MGVEVGGGGGGGRWEVGGIRWIQVEVILLPLNVINKRGATHDVLSIFVYILVNKREREEGRAKEDTSYVILTATLKQKDKTLYER